MEKDREKRSREGEKKHVDGQERKTGNGTEEERPRKRRSRFSEAPPQPLQPTPVHIPMGVPAEAIVAARATEIAKSLKRKPDDMSAPLPESVDAKVPALGNALSVLQMRKDLAQRIASIQNTLAAHSFPHKKAVSRVLRLDSQGREIDEEGKLVQSQAQVKTLKANLVAQRKAVNPYLAHKTSELAATVKVDPRLKNADRDKKARRSFQFVEQGTYVRQAEIERHKEKKKIMAGISSGRVDAPKSKLDDGTSDSKSHADDTAELNDEDGPRGQKVMGVEVPPPADEGIIPSMEWWDEQFLPAELRAQRSKSRALEQQDDFDKLALKNSRTHRLIQHIPPVKGVSGDSKNNAVLPVYLTKKERKRIRRQARADREREKRDQLMMGLIPAPEPKFKLSNFMKILGDQAVADPSKVGQRVMQQMRQRQLNHVMRNQARKLTPQERKERKRKKLQEDTSKEVHVAIFRVRELSDARHKFKVDVNAQQYNISGVVLSAGGAAQNIYMVCAEGGPKGIRRFVKLMSRRIDWNKKVSDEKQDEEDGEEDVSDDDDDAVASTGAKTGSSGPNRCDLLWQGIVHRRAFHSFKFQECRTAASARKLMESKSVAHYWDMAVNADTMLEAQGGAEL